jgi:hypothetical protein
LVQLQQQRADGVVVVVVVAAIVGIGTVGIVIVGIGTVGIGIVGIITVGTFVGADAGGAERAVTVTDVLVVVVTTAIGAIAPVVVVTIASVVMEFVAAGTTVARVATGPVLGKGVSAASTAGRTYDTEFETDGG